MPKKTRADRGGARKRLKPATTRRGLDPGEIVLDRTSAPIAELVALVEAAGGTAIGAYREPLSGNAVLLAALPIGAVEPTPFQRDLSPTHTKRLAAKIEESGSFLDPLVVVRGADGRLWTPNGTPPAGRIRGGSCLRLRAAAGGWHRLIRGSSVNLVLCAD